VVTDLKMPGGISGKHLFKWIERHRPDLAAHVIFTMSNARGEDAREMCERSSCRSVQKPFQIEDFLRALRQISAADPSSPVKR